MLRWTGGSKARASILQGASHPYGCDAVGVARSRSGLHCTDTRPQERRLRHHSFRHNFDGKNSKGKQTQRPSVMRSKSCGKTSVSPSRGSRGGPWSPPSSTQDDGERGVDCMALEWSLKAAAVASTPLAQRLPDTRTAPLKAIALEQPVAAERPLMTCGGAVSAVADLEEPTGSLPLFVFDGGNALLPHRDPKLWSPLRSGSWPLQESVEGWQPQSCGGDFFLSSELGEVEHESSDVFFDRRTPFASFSSSPKAHCTSAWLDEPVTLLTHEGFPYNILDGECDGPAGGDAFFAPVATVTSQGAVPDTGESFCWLPDHCDRETGTTAFSYCDAPPDYCESGAFLAADQLPRESLHASVTTVSAFASLLNKWHQGQGAAAHVHHAEPPSTQDECEWGGVHRAWFGGGVAAPWPSSGLPDVGLHVPAHTTSAGRGGRGGKRGRGGAARAQSHGLSLNLSGGVPAARYQAFQRRNRKS